MDDQDIVGSFSFMNLATQMAWWLGWPHKLHLGPHTRVSALAYFGTNVSYHIHIHCDILRRCWQALVKEVHDLHSRKWERWPVLSCSHYKRLRFYLVHLTTRTNLAFYRAGLDCTPFSPYTHFHMPPELWDQRCSNKWGHHRSTNLRRKVSIFQSSSYDRWSRFCS